MKCRTLNRRGHATSRLHRLWCRDCRNAQEVDAMIGFGLMQMQDEPASRQGVANTIAALDLQTDGPDLQTGGRYLRRAARRVGAYRLLRTARNGVICLLGMGVWWQYMNYTPDLHIPKTTLPTPNAFDYFRAAGEKVVYDYEVSDATGTPPKDAQPGPPADYTTYRDSPTEGRVAIHRIFHDKHLYTLVDKKLLLKKNQDALANVRAGLKYPYAEPYARTIDAKFSYYARFRAAARLLALDAAVKRETGDWNGAIQTHLDTMEMGAKIPDHAPLIGYLVGVACQAIGRANAWKCVEHLDTAQTRAAIARLQTIQAEQVSFADTMQEEEWFLLEGLRKQMHTSGWQFRMFSMGEAVQQFDWRGMVFLGWSNRVLLKDIKTYEDEAIRRCRLPYAQERALPPIPEPLDPLTKIILPVFAQGRFQGAYSSETQNTFLLTALALHAYALDHGGKHPQALADLAPRYLTQVPADPFALNGAPLKYRLASKNEAVTQVLPDGFPGKGQYLLYSVGPDGKDDGGQAIDALTRQPVVLDPATPRILADNKNRYHVQADSVGDIVAGVNMK